MHTWEEETWQLRYQQNSDRAAHPCRRADCGVDVQHRVGVPAQRWPRVCRCFLRVVVDRRRVGAVSVGLRVGVLAA